MKAFVLQALVDPDEKVCRWAFNALAQVGEAADVALMLQPWKDNRDDQQVFAAGLTTLAHLLERESLLSVLKSAQVELDAGVLMSLGQQTSSFEAELRQVRVNLDRATLIELTQATLLIGLNKAPDTLFSGRFPIADVIGDLNTHPDQIIAQYSFWATVEHPGLSLNHVRVAPAEFPKLPPNVQSWAYRTLTKSGALAVQHYEAIVNASESKFEVVREGVAIGLRRIYYDSLDVTVADWLLEEPCNDVKDALLEHMATHIVKSSAYRDEVLKAYREAAVGSILRSRLEAANRDDDVALEMRKISLQMNDPQLFASVVGTTMNNTQNFNATTNVGGLSNSGTGNQGPVQIISSAEALAAVSPVLQQLLQALQAGSAPAAAAGGIKFTEDAVAAPTKGNVTRVFDWLKKMKEGGDTLSSLGAIASTAYNHLDTFVEHLPNVLS